LSDRRFSHLNHISRILKKNRARDRSGIKITDEERDKLNVIKADFHGEWNYSIAAYT
jgi:hypothetical protein